MTLTLLRPCLVSAKRIKMAAFSWKQHKNSLKLTVKVVRIKRMLSDSEEHILVLICVHEDSRTIVNSRRNWLICNRQQHECKVSFFAGEVTACDKQQMINKKKKNECRPTLLMWSLNLRNFNVYIGAHLSRGRGQGREAMGPSLSKPVSASSATWNDIRDR